MEMLPELPSHRLRLRQLTRADADAIFAVYSDPDSMRYWSRLPMTDVSEAREMIDRIDACRAREDLLQWGIEDRTDGAIIGTCTLFQIDRSNGRAEIGYILRSDRWGHGYGGEAISRLLEFARSGLALRRIEADVDPNNPASLRCLEKIGFAREGYLRERWCVGGQLQDTVILGLLLREWGAAVGTATTSDGR
jgi:RimJ/RimL family protein N-acetyltransferase